MGLFASSLDEENANLPTCFLCGTRIECIFRNDGLALPLLDFDDGNAAAFIFASGNCLHVLPATTGGFRFRPYVFIYYVPAFLKRGAERLGFYSWISLSRISLRLFACAEHVPSVWPQRYERLVCCAVSDLCLALRLGWSGSALVIAFMGSSHGALLDVIRGILCTAVSNSAILSPSSDILLRRIAGSKLDSHRRRK